MGFQRPLFSLVPWARCPFSSPNRLPLVMLACLLLLVLASGQTQAQIPPTPVLTATGVTSAQIDLTWTWNPRPLPWMGIEVRRGATEDEVRNNPTVIADLVPSARSFIDTDVLANETYWYRLAPYYIVGMTFIYDDLSNTASATTDEFVEVSTPFVPLGASAAAWGDYDDDGDLDLAVAGRGSDGNSTTKVYRNDNGTFVDVAAAVGNVMNAVLTWFEYHRDGTLQLVVSGYDSHGDISYTKLYTYDKYSDDFGAIRTLPVASAIDWADFDNDGLRDLLIIGSEGSDVFSAPDYDPIGVGLPPLFGGACASADYDGDGDQDFVLSGQDSRTTPVVRMTKRFRNDGGVFNEDNLSAPNVSWGSLCWGDQDLDGVLELVVTGNSDSGPHTSLYTLGGGSEQLPTSLRDLVASAAWGDYDGDGDPDLILEGNAPLSNYYTTLYRSNGLGTFSQVGYHFLGLSDGQAVWGDYDNDDDLDLLVTGYEPDIQKPGMQKTQQFYGKTILYENKSPNQNEAPSPPQGLTASFDGSTATFSWSPGSDRETADAGLTYNLWVGTRPDEADVMPPASNLESGYRRVPRLGNVGHRTSWTISGLSPDQYYYWSVQTVDPGFKGSSFAPTQYLGDCPPPTPPAVTGVSMIHLASWAPPCPTLKEVAAFADKVSVVNTLPPPENNPFQGPAWLLDSSVGDQINAVGYTGWHTADVELDGRSMYVSHLDWDFFTPSDESLYMTIHDLADPTLSAMNSTPVHRIAGTAPRHGAILKLRSPETSIVSAVGCFYNDGEGDDIPHGIALAEYDISDPSSPAEASHWDIEGPMWWAYDFAIQEHPAGGTFITYVVADVNSYTGGDKGVYASSAGISCRSCCDCLASFEPQSNIWAIEIRGDYAYAVGDAIWVIDISGVPGGDPGQELSPTTTIPLQGLTAADIAIEGQYAYVAMYSAPPESETRLRVYDLSDPVNPMPVAWLNVDCQETHCRTRVDAVDQTAYLKVGGWLHKAELDLLSAETPEGTNVTVNLGDDVTVTFDTVEEAGETRLVFLDEAPEIPLQWQLANDPPLFMDISTTAQILGPVEVCLQYDESQLSVPEDDLALLHYEDPLWLDVTRFRLPALNLICGEVGTLSPFALVGPSGATGVGEGPAHPAGYSLNPAVPNPFRPATTIRFGVPTPSPVSLRLYDATGRLVRTLLDGNMMPAGWHSEVWDGKDEAGRPVASGVYHCQLKAGAFLESRRMVLLR